MASETDIQVFLPCILSVFYAVFDVNKGTKIVYQVPEGLITSPAPATSNSPAFGPLPDVVRANSRTSSSSTGRNSRAFVSPSLLSSPYQKQQDTSSPTLFSFEDISRYVIPQSPLCGRLVVCATRKHRIIGFPVELYGSQYERNYFRYNVCFVFDRHADLSCYEPIVRKIGRVLTACEEESSFLSSPDTSHRMQAVLEQLYNDLNTESETSIPIDRFNSIELKIFPFYPNPPPVHDWMVPIALIDLTERVEANWDLTVATICPFIDGINHVSRIADLSDCDLNLTRRAVAHLLYYKVITIIDIFQYSNIYTLCRSLQSLASEQHVKDDCGPYVTKPHERIPEWPQLLYLYSRLRHGITVLEWMQECKIHEMNIDPRRFIGFGLIKGFIRRVHRWPLFVLNSSANTQEKIASGNSSDAPISSQRSSIKSPTSLEVMTDRVAFRGRSGVTATQAQIASTHAYVRPRRSNTTFSQGSVDRVYRNTSSDKSRVSNGPRIVSTSRIRRQSLQQPSLHLPTYTTADSTEPNNTLLTNDEIFGANGNITNMRLSTSPSSQTVTGVVPGYPPELKNLLDGTRSSDELGIFFEAGWPKLNMFLKMIGDGSGAGESGHVVILYQ